MQALREAQINNKHHRIVYDPDLMPAPAPALFTPEHWASRDALRGTAEGRGAAWFIDTPTPAGAGWVLRHYRRGGLPGRLIADRYLHWPTHLTRPWREFRLGQQLHAAGLPVPRPVAARVVRHGLVDTGDLITECVPGALALADGAIDDAIDDADWHGAGASIAALHRHGVWHADLNARNLLRRDDGRWMLIDLDRARPRSGQRWKQANLARLRRSLDKIAGKHPGMAFDEARWQHLLAGYAGAAGP